MANALSDLAARNGSFPLDLQFCEYLNVSFCPSSETDTVRCQGWYREGEEVLVSTLHVVEP